MKSEVFNNYFKEVPHKYFHIIAIHLNTHEIGNIKDYDTNHYTRLLIITNGTGKVYETRWSVSNLSLYQNKHNLSKVNGYW